MIIGIGGAGSRLAARLNSQATIINISPSELQKLEAGRKILAPIHDARGQLHGAGKDPRLGRQAYAGIREELLELIEGAIVFAATAGGTGGGITSALLEELSTRDSVPEARKTMFALLLPYAEREPVEYVANTLAFLRGPLSTAIDSGNTGSIFLFSNRLKFESRLSEEEYNQMLVDSLGVFLAIPAKSDGLDLLDGHLDGQDFGTYLSRPYFNYFTYFEYSPDQPVGEQLEKSTNPLLLPPDSPIEALFLLEVPKDEDPTIFYDILEYFTAQNVTPSYSVVRNPERKKPFLTVSMLYSRKPAELVEDFSRIHNERARAKIAKAVEQHVNLPVLHVNLEQEAKRVAKERGSTEEDILALLRRIGKL